MALKPWHTVVSPREDLREGKPLDAGEVAAANCSRLRRSEGARRASAGFSLTKTADSIIFQGGS